MIEDITPCTLATDDRVGLFRSRIFKDCKSDDDYLEIFLSTDTIEYAEKCVEHINNMPDEMVDTICRAIIKSSTKEYELENVRDILKYCRFYFLYTFDWEIEDKEIAYTVDGYSEWGKDIVFAVRGNRVLYVGNCSHLSSLEVCSPWKDDAYYKNLNSNCI
ncbi:MAG: hypothetical protein K2H26_04280 [Ruminococcus sp.]|nr:hypothetical protein [Ruminococcus sp.]